MDIIYQDGFQYVPGIWYSEHDDFVEEYMDWWCFVSHKDDWYDVVAYCTYVLE